MAVETMGTELFSHELVAQREAEIAARVTALREETGQMPTLRIITNNYPGDPDAKSPTKTYVDLKVRYGLELGLGVENWAIYDQQNAFACMQQAVDYANGSDGIHGIIVQLPLRPEEDQSENECRLATLELLSSIAPEKDVDGLRPDSARLGATPRAALDLLDARNIDYLASRVRILGRGLLLGQPLFRHLAEEGVDVQAYDIDTPDLEKVRGINEADVLISAMGRPGLITPELFDDMSRPRTLVDVGTAEKSNAIHGDVSDEMRQAALENGWSITPHRGGIGPLTVRTLLLKVVDAAEMQYTSGQLALNLG